MISDLEKYEVLITIPAISQKLNYIKEAVEDDLEHLESSVKEEALRGHKSAKSSFYSYKEHIAMTDDCVITACVVTSCEKSDGPILEELYHKSKDNGVTIEAIVGDKDYSGKDNIQFTKKEHVHLVFKLHAAVSRERIGIFYNKDVALFVCPEGHMALNKTKTGIIKGRYNPQETHYFDIKHCQILPSKKGCYKEGAESKTYSITLKSDERIFQKRFQETEYFKENAKHSYKIEAKNAELKHRHGLDVAKDIRSF